MRSGRPSRHRTAASPTRFSRASVASATPAPARSARGRAQRARDVAPLPDSRAERELVGRFTAAFEAGDVPGVLALLTDDALLTMPPEPLEYQGPLAIGQFLSTVPAGGALERFRLVPIRANGQ